jgi:amino acid transporter
LATAGRGPSIFKWLHPRFRTPWVGIFILGFGMFIQILIGISIVETIVVFIVASAFSWLLAYIIAHIDALILRAKYPKSGKNLIAIWTRSSTSFFFSKGRLPWPEEWILLSFLKKKG